jgi:DNA polymerase III alpha subunit
MRIVSKRSLGEQSTYDIGLAKDHNFVLQNGLVASNCFNKSHSVSYSMLTYITAYLKANYPVEFFCALMTVRSKTLQPKFWAQKAPEYTHEAGLLGIQINPPSINGSDLEFSIRDGEIYFGFSGIRDVGKTASKAIVKTRGKTPFKDVHDFLSRSRGSKVTIKTFVSLIKAGGFDKLGYDRADLLEKSQELHDFAGAIVAFEERKRDAAIRRSENARKEARKIEIIEFVAKAKAKKKAKEELSEEDDWWLERKDRLKTMRDILATEGGEEIVADMPLRMQDEYTEHTSLRKQPDLKEKEPPIRPEVLQNTRVVLTIKQLMEQAHYIGCYIGAHPARMIAKRYHATDLNKVWIGEQPRVVGVVNSIKAIVTKKKRQKMAFLEIDDGIAIAEVTVFPRLWQNVENKLENGSLIIMTGKVESEEPNIKLIADSIELYKEQE